MREDLLPIGQMAKLNHITIATLRLYDDMGLLSPRYKDPQTGYRYYDIAQNARLDMIAYMKELGMSLAEIADVLRKEDITLIESILIEKNEQMHRQMRELRARHNAVERAIACIERYRKSPTTGTIALEYIDRRYIWGLPCAENFYQKDIRAFEKELIALRRALLERGFEQVHALSTGTSIDMEDFERGSLVPKQVFVFLDYKTAAQYPETSVVDSGMFACIYLDHYDDEPLYAQRLRDFCLEHHYAVAGDYICEVLTEFNVFDSESRSMFLRLQVPVSFR